MSTVISALGVNIGTHIGIEMIWFGFWITHILVWLKCNWIDFYYSHVCIECGWPQSDYLVSICLSFNEIDLTLLTVWFHWHPMHCRLEHTVLTRSWVLNRLKTLITSMMIGTCCATISFSVKSHFKNLHYKKRWKFVKSLATNWIKIKTCSRLMFQVIETCNLFFMSFESQIHANNKEKEEEEIRSGVFATENLKSISQEHLQ